LQLELIDLIRGISWWLQKSNWPPDFHNEAYHELYDLKINGLDDDWWDKTADRLQNWLAIRPFSKDTIKKRGAKTLPRLRELYFDICKKTQKEPSFFDYEWEDVEKIFNLLKEIKGVNSPVFASKLGHFVFPNLFIVMDNKATGVNNYQIYWQSMKEAWYQFTEKIGAKKILLKEIEKHSQKPVHNFYPFEVKIIELCSIGKNKKPHDHNKSNLKGEIIHKENGVVRGKEGKMIGLDENYSCELCMFSINKLKEMSEKEGNKEMFSTFGRRVQTNIYEVDTVSDCIVFRRSRKKDGREGNISDGSSIKSLILIHNGVHSGEIELDPNIIDKLKIKDAYMRGNYFAGLLRHLGCRKIISDH
jgi:hypothetical protein